MEVGNLKYTINTSNTNATVKGLSSAGNTVTQLTIPGSFAYNGTTYFVKTIGSYAFADNNTITDITVEYGINTLQEAAFGDMTKLKKLVLPSSLVSIHKYAGYFDGSEHFNENITAQYWTASEAPGEGLGKVAMANYINAVDEYNLQVYDDYRSFGFAIRPVLK